jgi:hypothetical protein
MGGFFGSVYTKDINRDKIRRTLLKVGKQRRCQFLMAPEIDGWVGIYPSGSGQDVKVSEAIHRALKDRRSTRHPA